MGVISQLGNEYLAVIRSSGVAVLQGFGYCGSLCKFNPVSEDEWTPRKFGPPGPTVLGQVDPPSPSVLGLVDSLLDVWTPLNCAVSATFQSRVGRLSTQCLSRSEFPA